MNLRDPAHPMHDVFFALLAVDDARTYDAMSARFAADYAKLTATSTLQDLADAALAKAAADGPRQSPSLTEALHALAADVARMTGTAAPMEYIALRAAKLAGYAAPHRLGIMRDAMLAQMGDVE